MLINNLLMIDWRDPRDRELRVMNGNVVILSVHFNHSGCKTRADKLEFLHAVVLEALNTPVLMNEEGEQLSFDFERDVNA
jgi:hypothetical protein